MERELQDVCQRLGLTNIAVEFSTYSSRYPFGAFVHWRDDEVPSCAYGAGATVEEAVQEASAKMLAMRANQAAPLRQVA